ncbi:amidohydrolase [Cohnella nanjingensis]|uniref:Amidohydrolase n=1 Tax=Cohnella nanjingensis TaxID=1387779 RepID=A0A7X0VIR1_9BACL|nr:amidohydrolase [Cohnella nanjingensis]MBB6675472.1 amidohydrolase [Cohnella nanjingensis]
MSSGLLIARATILTVNADDEVIDEGAILIERGRIADIGPSAALEARYPNAERLDAAGHAVLPGLVNLHLHSGLIRGTAEDLPVFEWLTKYVDPKHRALTDELAHAAARLSYTEAILSGTTCVMDMYRFMHRCADAADELGLRATLAPYVVDKPGMDYFESLDKNVRLVQERNNTSNGRIQVWFALEHLAYCTEGAYRQAAALAEKYDTGIHTHGEESIEMARRLKAETGRWPVELFYDRGILGPRTVLAHCVWLRDEEMELLARTGTSVAHCPVSNLKLASGIAPVKELLDLGVTVGIGTDGVKENNNLDMLEELKFVPLLQKARLLDATVIKAERALRMATIDGAKALGLDREIGSLEIGKKADLIAVDFRKHHLTPVIGGRYHNVVSNLVYSASGADVNHVVIDGRVVMRDRRLLSADAEEIRQSAQAAAERLFALREPFIPV